MRLYAGNPVRYLATELRADYENTGGGCMTLTAPMPTTEKPHGAVVIVGKYDDQIDNFSGRTVTEAGESRDLTGFSAMYLPEWYDPEDVQRDAVAVYESEDFYSDVWEKFEDAPEEAYDAEKRLSAWMEAARTYSAVKAFMAENGVTLR